VKAIAGSIWKKVPAGKLMQWKVGKGTVIQGPYTESSFEAIGVTKDLAAVDTDGKPAKDIAWTHRKGNGFDIYFVSNQQKEARGVVASLRITGLVPEIWDAVTGEQKAAEVYTFKNGCTKLPLYLPANGSVFIVLRKQTTATEEYARDIGIAVDTVRSTWTVTFDPTKGGPAQPVVFEQLKDWSTNDNNAIKYYSGTAVYTTTFDYTAALKNNARYWLNVGRIANMGTIYVNGIACGVVWTAPYQVDIKKALRAGKNELRIEVTNTWFNRLKGDMLLPEKERITRTNAPFWAKDKPLLPAGLLGPVTVITEY
jgi:hypothetical protein